MESELKLACAAATHDKKDRHNSHAVNGIAFVTGTGYVPALVLVAEVPTCAQCWVKAGKPEVSSYATALKERGEYEGELPEVAAEAKNKQAAASRPLAASPRVTSLPTQPGAAPRSATSSSQPPAAPRAAAATKGGMPKAAARTMTGSALPKAAAKPESATGLPKAALAHGEATTSFPKAAVRSEIATQEHPAASLVEGDASRSSTRPFQARQPNVPTPTTFADLLGGKKGADKLAADVRKAEVSRVQKRRLEEAAWLEDFMSNGWTVTVDQPLVDYETMSLDEMDQKILSDGHWHAGAIVYRRRKVVEGKVVASGPKRTVVRKHGPVVVDDLFAPEMPHARKGNATHWKRPIGCVAYHAEAGGKFSVSSVTSPIPYRLVRNVDTIETGAGKCPDWMPYVAPKKETKLRCASAEYWLDLTGKPWCEADVASSVLVWSKRERAYADRLILRDGRETALLVEYTDGASVSSGEYLLMVLAQLVKSKDKMVENIVRMLEAWFPFGEGEYSMQRAVVVESEAAEVVAADVSDSEVADEVSAS